MKNYSSLVFIFIARLAISQGIYVAKDGNDDTNDGSISSPYLTIQKAADQAVAGDIIYIREGTYEETVTPRNSGTDGNPIIYTSYQEEKVIISAMAAVNDFQQDEGSVYKTQLDWDLGQRMFVLNGETIMDLARWPNNTDGNRYTPNSLRNDGGSGPDESPLYLTDSEIPNLPWENGGSLFFYGDRPGSGWLAWRLPITASSPGRVEFRSTHNANSAFVLDFHPPKDGGDFFLEGIREALDYENEWYFDPSDRMLYLQVPGGVEPAENTILVSRRENTINIELKNYIEFRNLAVFGGTVRIRGEYNKLYGVTSLYGGMTRGSNSTGILANVGAINIVWNAVKFRGNVIEKCEVAYADGSGIKDAGDNTLIINNHIHDCGYLGDYEAPLSMRGGIGKKALHNTIYKGGRDAIQCVADESEIAFNDVSRSNLIADDCGLFYYSGSGNAEAAAADPRDITIHHNWFHDAEGRGELKKAAGIYLDTNPNKFDVYRNVVWNVEWTGIQMNWNAIDINIYNNTIIDPQSGAMGAWHYAALNTSFTNVNVWNNVTNVALEDDPNTQELEGDWEPQSDQQNNMTVTEGFVSMPNRDFRLLETSPLIDQGRQIDGITDGFAGSAPDIGAYELGDDWVPGIDWDVTLGPANRCYGLPGEVCELAKEDKDLDGVFDSSDLCPDTILGAEVDADGCAIVTVVDPGPVDPILSILDDQELASLYPNPVDGNEIRIPVTDGSASLEWTIVSSSGRVIKRGTGLAVNSIVSIDVGDLANGYYLLAINSILGRSVIQRFIKRQ